MPHSTWGLIKNLSIKYDLNYICHSILHTIYLRIKLDLMSNLHCSNTYILHISYNNSEEIWQPNFMKYLEYYF